MSRLSTEPISKNWTDDERLWICLVLAESILQSPQDTRRVSELADTIRVVCGAGQMFLESIRLQIENAIATARANIDALAYPVTGADQLAKGNRDEKITQ